MHVEALEQLDPAVLKIQALLQKIDRLRLRLPEASRRDVESILVRQVAKELDRALPWQAGHGARTAVIACLIGQELGLDVAALHNLQLAALIHDIGILMLPSRLRSGSEPLDPASYVAIQQHSRLGANLLDPFAFLREASILVAHHHEWWDGSGYPFGLRGEFIPLGARILAVADACEAIHVPGVSNRALRDHIALRILRVASGTQFDPAAVNALCTRCSSSSHSVSPLP